MSNAPYVITDSLFGYLAKRKINEKINVFFPEPLSPQTDYSQLYNLTPKGGLTCNGKDCYAQYSNNTIKGKRRQISWYDFFLATALDTSHENISSLVTAAKLTQEFKVVDTEEEFASLYAKHDSCMQDYSEECASFYLSRGYKMLSNSAGTFRALLIPSSAASDKYFETVSVYVGRAYPVNAETQASFHCDTVRSLVAQAFNTTPDRIAIRSNHEFDGNLYALPNNSYCEFIPSLNFVNACAELILEDNDSESFVPYIDDTKNFPVLHSTSGGDIDEAHKQLDHEYCTHCEEWGCSTHVVYSGDRVCGACLDDHYILTTDDDEYHRID